MDREATRIRFQERFQALENLSYHPWTPRMATYPLIIRYSISEWMIHDDFPFSSADSHDDLPIPNDDVPLRKANNSRVTPPQLHRETVQASPWDRPKASTRLRSMAMRSRYDATRRRLEHVWCLLVAKMLDVLTLSHWCWFQVADLAAEGHGNFADQLLKGLATSISLEIAKVNPVQFRGLLPTSSQL